ncbi:MAG: peptide chain release factor 2 [Candidatus Moranbacteria bacterium CG10_big_fil_rev_8_21_14_0_10_35_21]|nr:MAG: peptide chain release factor 2 [Candidatus Moranbacteria bacterium CG10_big_fil_rev_8_21_14_0_10_35_21]PJA88808.1 MAG: peptide chain release factor 2 [Candidatus Moranbacteria bacterium CG_4_9_14_3_um_filter_36_9]
MQVAEEKLESIQKKMEKIKPVFDLRGKEKRIVALEKDSSEKNFWSDSQKASKIMQELEGLKSEKEIFLKAQKEADELKEFFSLISEKSGSEEKKDLAKKVAELEEKVSQLEQTTLFSGKYDQNDALVAIYSGAGGLDAQDWAEMLLRMYLRFAERKKMKAKIISESRGQEAGIKSAIIEIKWKRIYGELKGENGVHRLVRLSPFNAKNLRQTSFALVEVLPVIDASEKLEIKPADLKIDVYRSSGAGGQSVDTTDSAVRITHLPTGIVVTCQNERSQLQNKEQAIKVLMAKLYQKQQEKEDEERQKIRGEHQKVEWGSQIRSYVLHPYKMVKDHRTKHESKNPEEVLDGELDEFLNAYLNWDGK